MSDAVTSSRSLFSLGFVGFLLIGALQAVYGPAFDPIAARFGVGRGDVGLIASAHFLGTMAGVLLAGALLPRFGLRRLLRLGSALMVLGLAGVAFAPTWPLALLASLIGGLGFGHVSVTFNVGGARLGERAPVVLNLLNACFGLGSVLAPLLVALTLGLGTAAVAPFLALGAVAAVLLAVSGRLPELPETTTAATGRAPLVPLALFGLLFVLYVGVEAGVGAWMTTQLDDSGVAGAAAWTSGFWLTVTVGRVLAAPIAARVPLPTLVTVCAALSSLALLTIRLVPVSAAPFVYLVAGLAIAPIFATTLGWFGQHLPTRLAPIILACGGLGGTLFPALLGRLSAAYGTSVLPLGFAATALSVTLVALVIQVVLRGSARDAAGRTG